MTRTTRRAAAVLGVAALSLGICACGGQTSEGGAASSSAEGVSVENCGQTVTVDKPVTKLFANDGNIISIALAAGAHDELTAVSNLQRDRAVLELAYGDEQVADLNVVAEKYPTLENIVAAQPEMVFAGWGYGFSESNNLTPDMLTEKGIGTYLLSETCRQDDGARGTMPPWEALSHDITSIGALTGNREEAARALEGLTARRTAVEQAPKADKEPVAFLFDSGEAAVFTSGSFGAPQAIFDSSGVKNAAADVKDTWTEVSWEKIAATQPDIIYFVDYPGQTYDQKVAALRANPATKNLPAVTEGRFVNLPYAMWTSGPLNVDAAEYVRKSLEYYGLQPASDVTTALDLTRLRDLPGNDWLK